MALLAGSIAFVGFNADGSDNIAFVALVDIGIGETIIFEDNEWNGTGWIDTNESAFSWTTNSVVSAGTIIRIDNISSVTITANIGTVASVTGRGTNRGLAGSTESLYAYQGSASSPVFITAVSNNAFSDSATGSLTNTGLTAGVNAIALSNNIDIAAYNSSRSGQANFADYQSLINNPANWITQDGSGDQSIDITAPDVPFSSTAFTIAAVTPTVNLSVSSASGSEAGQTVITVTATASSAVSDNQTVNLGVTGTGITAEDYTLSNSSITILNGQTTGSVTFTVVDDVLVEGTETATLTISNPSSGITLGTTSQNIVITDNDTPVTPTVNLSVSSNAGTEAGTTIITVTATVSSAVSSNQTVALGVSGTGITTSDYYLSNTTIIIPNGQTSGSVNFIVADDAIAEGTETATLTISNPSAGLTLGTTTTQNITITNNDNSFLTKVGGATSVNGAEIPAFDSGSKRLFVVAGNTIEFYTVSTTGTLTLAGSLTPTITPPAGAVLIPNSVAVKNGVVAVAYAVAVPVTGTEFFIQQTGKVAFFNAANGNFINAVDVGALPDMLTFTPDGTKVLVANEGEPNSYNRVDSVDPEGSISIINIANGVASATVQTADFTSFNSQMATLKAAGVRIIGPGSTVAQDLEPEYIAVSPDGLTATITLQENNAIAILDIASATITQILPLGAKNYNLPGNGIDASDQDSGINGGINIQNWPVFGLYQPDAIASFSINGQAYYITANEGDSRNYPGFNEEIRVGAAGYVLDPTAFPNAATLKQNANLGRLQLTNATGDTDGDGDIDRIESFGARSFSIWNANATQVFDSGDQLEQITAAKTPTLFNSDGTAATFNTRSDNKGPEPEGVVVGVINGRTYAFIGIERSGDVFVYDVTNPNQPTFVQYINIPEDTATEGLTFISAADSPTGKPLLVTASEVSKTVAIFEVKVPTYIHAIQGNGATAALTGTQTIEGIVTRAFQGSTKLNGFYVQEEDTDADNDATTSEAIFIYDPTGLFTGNVGDKVRVTGTAGEFTSGTTGSSLTQLSSITTVLNLGASALPTVTNIQLPVTSISGLERYEGMLVNISAGSGDLTVTENYQLGRFGQVVLAATGASNQTGTDARLDQYTQFNAPSVSGYSAYLADIATRKIYLDDGSGTQNLDPILFGRGGNSLSASNTLRSGDTVNNITGILDQRFEGYRIQTTTPVNFNPTNTRPNTPPDVGSSATLKVASANVLNFFNGNGLGGGFPTARGADTLTEFNRQRDKIVQGLVNSGADVIGLMELENDGYGSTSAIQDLVNSLNAVAGEGTYAFVNPGTSLATDAISVGMIYKPGKVTVIASATIPTGYGTGAFDLVGRKPLAVTFQQNSNSERFTAVVNHFKSKGSSSGGVGDADAGDGQGLSNGTRTRQAQDLATWLATNPTGTTDSDYLILGDLNAYAQENPLTTLASAGYNNLVSPTSYSYVFDGQVGSLDHALANGSLTTQVTEAEKWHINADEPTVLDYNTEFKSAGQQISLYSADQFRFSDHDPVIIGLNLNSNQAPTAVTLSNTVTTLVENTNTATRIKVANIAVTDDGRGSNTLTVTGTDASFFEISGTELYLKANTVLDYETKSTYNVTVVVDDSSVGSTPDATTAYTLTLQDQKIESVDLSTYTRIGRYDLPEPKRTTAPANSVLAQEVSAVTYNWDTDTLFVLGDGSRSIVQITKTGQLINSMTLALGSSPQGTDFYDTEGLTYVGDSKFVLVEERDRQANLFTYAPGTTLTKSDVQTVKLGTTVGNIGIEGISYDPLTGGFIAVKEISPQGIFQTGIDFAAGTATNGSSTTVNSTNLFDPALANVLDFADVYALSNLSFLNGLPDYSKLLVLSQESGKIVNIDRSGNISSSLTITSDAGNPFSVADQQHEGLTMDNNGLLYVVSENGGGDIDHPQLWVYAPANFTYTNQAPIAVSLNVTNASLAENTSTATRIKVGNIIISDDALGTNNLTVSGADASFFEISGRELYLKAGTTLDYETKTSYSINVNVDDPTLGSTTDATTAFTLAVNDLNEAPSPLIISEIAPWSSGNSSVRADWFEVTNTSSSAVDITGWKIDDDSNSFAASVALSGITTIAAGESVIFLESSTLVTTKATFVNVWLGGNQPVGLQIGNYTGAGIGLSTAGDSVNLFNASGTKITGVSFGASPTGTFPTFDNSAGLANTTTSTLSIAGIKGAYGVTDTVGTVTSQLIGSPGRIANPNQAPTGSPTATLNNTTEDTAISINSSDLLAGFSDIDAGDTLSVVNLTATNGALVNNNNGTYTFTPTLDFNGVINLTYGVTDGTATLANQTRSFSVTAVNDAATITGTAIAAVTEDAATTLTATGSLTVNDVDAGENIFNTCVTSTAGNLGSLTITNAGIYNYSVANSAVQSFGAGQTKNETFTVSSIDDTATQNIVVTINGVNDAPTGSATGTLALGTEDTAYTINVANLLTGFSDVDGDTLSVSGLTANNGTLVNNNGSYTFNPTANFNGTVSLTYNVIDGNGGSVNATQSFNIAAVNDAPVLIAPSQTANSNISQIISGISLTDVDAGNSSLQVTLALNNGSATLGSTSGLNFSVGDGNQDTYMNFSGSLSAINTALNNLSYRSNFGFFGNDTITLSVNDQGNTGSGGALTDSKAIALTVYNLINGTTNNDSLIATPNPDRIFGNGGNDTITSTVANAGQNDLFDGGIGTDTLVISGGTASTALTLNVANTSNQLSGISGLVVQNFEIFNFANFLGNLNATGSTGNDSITGGVGNDTLDGGAGTNTLAGGAGNDTYIISTLTNTITEAANAGVDTVLSSVTYTLATNVENLVLIGTTDLNGTGNTLNNTLTGNSGNNTLNGGTGADNLIGGAGDDAYIVDNVGDVVVELSNEGTDTVNSSITYTLSENVENLTFSGTGNINGTGNSLNNIITGNTGNNILDGGFGNDTLIGGLGNDTYIVDSVNDVVTELAGGGTDTVTASISWVLGAELENLTLLGTADINATGNNLNNILTGNSSNNILTGGDGNDTINGGAGNDTLDGGGGTNTLAGGTGDDTYIISTLTNTITEAANAGVDTVLSSVTYTLATNVENLVLTGTTDLNGTGNTLNNTLTGNSSNNTLNGGTGADDLMGGAGNDTYIVDNTSDNVFELFNEGIDTVNTSVTYTLSENVENLTLTGSSSINGTGNGLNNIITGNAGSNILNGGSGADIFFGGLGNDTLYLGLNDAAGDTVNYAAGDGADTIYQFERTTSGDKVHFSGIMNIDVVTLGSNTQLRVGDGITNAGFGTGQLLVTLSSTSGFTGFNVNQNLFGSSFSFS